jgi:hypothetical protein
LIINHGQTIGVGLLFGTFARIAMLRSDYRQYPTYPHGYATHLFLGIIAALVGAVSIPALVEGEWTAVTFLVLVSQQFREIRSMERDSLKALEDDELVPRGSAYIEDIARVFEARYYIVIFVSAVTSAGVIHGSVLLGAGLGLIAFALGALTMRYEKLGSKVEVRAGKVVFSGPDLYIDDIFIMNVGMKESREFITQHGLGAILIPRDENARDTIANLGQRQAILHDISVVLGMRGDLDTPELNPVARRQISGAGVGVFVVPMDEDIEAMIEVIKRVPVLEAARGKSARAKAGKVAG